MPILYFNLINFKNKRIHTAHIHKKRENMSNL